MSNYSYTRVTRSSIELRGQDVLYSGSPNGGSNGDYRRLIHLAHGGMSEVSLAARGPSGGAPFVVLKQLSSLLERRPAARRLLEEEAQLLSQLSHPNIVRAYPTTEVDGRFSLPLEFVYGDTLNKVQAQSLRQGVLLPEVLSAHLLRQYASALSYLHRYRLDRDLLTHGDISPQNLMVGYCGRATLIDLGVSNAMRARGQLVAKPAYASPEQMLGLRCGTSSDVFALGIVAWELLVGRRLVKSNHPIQAAEVLLNEPITAPSALREGVSPELEAIVLGMLETNARDRISAEEAETLLNAFLQRHAYLDRLDAQTSRFMHRYAPEMENRLQHFFSSTLQPSA